MIDLNHSHLSVLEIPLMSLFNGSRFRIHISTPIRPHRQHPSPLSRDGGPRDPARVFADPSPPPAAEGASSPSSAEEGTPSPATQVSGPSPSSAMVDDGGNSTPLFEEGIPGHVPGKSPSPPSLEGGPPGLEPGKSPTPTGKGNSASLGHTVLFTGASPHEEHVDLSGTIIETKLYFPIAIRVQRYLPTSSRYEEQYEQYTEEIFIIRDDKFKLDNDQQPRADTGVDVTSERVRARKQRDIVTAEFILTSRDTDVSAEQVRAGEQLGDIGEAVSLVSTAQTGSLHRLSGEEGYALAHRDASSKPSNYTTRTNEIVPVSVTTGTSDNSTLSPHHASDHDDTCSTTCHGCKMEGGVSEGRSVSNYTPGTNRIVPITPGTHGIVPGTSELVRTLIPVTAGELDKVTSSQRNAHDLDEPRRTTSCRNYSTEGGLAEDRSAPDGVRLVLGVLTGRTDITPCLVSTSDESADNRSMSRGNSIGPSPDTYHTNAIIRALANSSIGGANTKKTGEPAHASSHLLSLHLTERRPDHEHEQGAALHLLP